MKKILLPLILLVVIFPLFGKVTIDESVPAEYWDRVEKTLFEVTDGRKDVPVLFSSFVLDGDMVSFSLQVEDQVMNTTVPIVYLEEEITNMLYYNPQLFSEGDILDYASNSSFSTLSPAFGKGNLLKAVDEKGITKGVFAVREHHNTALELDAIFLSTLYPGIKLEKSKGIDLDLTFALSPKTLDFSFEAGSSFYSSIYPFLPYISLGFDKTGEGLSGNLGLGIKTIFSFSSIWNNKIMRNISLSGKAEALLRLGQGVKMGGRWNLSCLWRPISWFMLSAGYTYDDKMGGMISISLGGLL